MKTNSSQIESIAQAFIAQLSAEIGADTMRLVIKANTAERNPSVCHSHDYCDANEAMEAAFIACGLPSPVESEATLNDDALIALWESAWRRAKAILSASL